MSTNEDWSDEDIAEYVRDLLTEISEGVYDKHLKAIARACFSRRDARDGTKSVVPEGTPFSSFSEVRDDFLDPNAVTVVLNTGNPVPSSRPLVSGIDFILAVPKNTRVFGVPIITRGGLRYKKSDIIGQELVYPGTSPKALQGAILRVTDVNRRGFTVTILSEPVTRQGNYWTYWNVQEPICLPWKMADRFLSKIMKGQTP